MATPKKDRRAPPGLGPKASFRVAAERYIADGGEEQYLAPIVRFLGPEITVAEIDDAQISRVRTSLFPHLKNSSAHRQVTVPIRAVTNYAMGTGRTRGQGRAPVRWLNPDEAERLIVAASHPEHIGLHDPGRQTLAKIAFMLGSGAATGEVFSINARDRDPDSGAWRLPGIRSMMLPRDILLPERATRLLGVIPKTGRAFLTPNGEPYVLRNKGGGQMAEAFGKVRMAAGLDREITPATCRKTWAVWFHAQTRSLPALIAAGGWSGPRSAKPYADIGGPDLAHWLHSLGWDFRDSASYILS